jgi:hypothetical protein
MLADRVFGQSASICNDRSNPRHRVAPPANALRANDRQGRQRAGYIGASPRTAIGGFDEGAVVAFASDPLSNF